MRSCKSALNAFGLAIRFTPNNIVSKIPSILLASHGKHPPKVAAGLSWLHSTNRVVPCTVIPNYAANASKRPYRTPFRPFSLPLPRLECSKPTRNRSTCRRYVPLACQNPFAYVFQTYQPCQYRASCLSNRTCSIFSDMIDIQPYMLTNPHTWTVTVIFYMKSLTKYVQKERLSSFVAAVYGHGG